MNDVSTHVGQAVIAPGEAIGQLRMVQTHEMKNRGVEIVDVHTVFSHADSMIVGRSVDHAAFHPCAGKPRRERPGMMFAPFGVGGIIERGSAEFGRPHDKRVVEQSPSFQVLQERRDRLVDVLGQRCMLADHVAVGIPIVRGTGIDQFHEADPSLDKPSRHEALPGEAGGPAA